MRARARLKRMFRTLTLLVLIQAATRAAATSGARFGGRHARRELQSDGVGPAPGPATGAPAHPLAALRDQREGIVRIYGSYLTSVVANETERGEQSQVAGCVVLTTSSGEQETVQATVHLLSRGSGIEGYFYIDCLDAHPGADLVTLRLQDGSELGRRLGIILMETERRGKLASCTGPVHTDRPWLKQWVEYHAAIGVERFIVNVPMGPQIDDLFTDARAARLANNGGYMMEMTPDSVGTERLKKFDFPGLEWHDYYPSATVSYYSQILTYNACQYRLRYEYDYVMQFDIDEFFMLSSNTAPEYVSFPQFLDANFPKDAPSLTFITVRYPAECRSRLTGLYPYQFSLGWRDLPDATKIVTRPLAVGFTHIHYLLDVSVEWRERLPPGVTWKDISETAVVPLTKAFVKHIRPFKTKGSNGQLHDPLCHFPSGLRRSQSLFGWVVGV